MAHSKTSTYQYLLGKVSTGSYVEGGVTVKEYQYLLGKVSTLEVADNLYTFLY